MKANDVSLTVLCVCVLVRMPFSAAMAQSDHGSTDRAAIDTLVVVDPDPSTFGSPEHFLSRTEIHEYARESGYAVVKVEDSFLKSHMIIVLQSVPLKLGISAEHQADLAASHRTPEATNTKRPVPSSRSRPEELSRQRAPP